MVMLITNAAQYVCSVLSAFFRKGQVIETFRGGGIYQPAIDLAIEKLRAGAWVRSVHSHRSLFLALKPVLDSRVCGLQKKTQII
jgi:hypothetical protein